MTHEEKKQIGKMRAAGMSYTRIAEALDISINSVKSYCRRHGLGADTALQETQPVQAESCQPPQEATACEQCGSPVRQQAGRKKTPVLFGRLQTGMVGSSPWRDEPQGRASFCVRILRYAVFKVRCVGAPVLLTLVRRLCPKPEGGRP